MNAPHSKIKDRARNFLAALVVLIASTATPALANAPVCTGTDMLSELQTRAPDRYKKVQEESAKLPNAQAILWKIEKPGVSPSYLFGTMHVSDPRIANLTPTAQAAIAGAKSVALEVADLSDNAVAEAMTKSAQLVVYTDGTTLDGKLSPEEFAKVRDLVAKSGIPGEVAGLVRPWMVSMLLAVSDCERKQVASGAPVLDAMVAAEAHKHNIPVVGLETIEEQLGALAAIPDDQQIEMLKVALLYADRTQDLLETLVQMYVKREIGAAMPFQVALAAEHGKPESIFDGFKKILLVDRNAKMRDSALPLLEKGDAFIAVGSLHLPGDTGLVALLRDAGYTITAVE